MSAAVPPPVPPAQQPFPPAQQPYPPTPGYPAPTPPPRKSWVARHKILTGVLAVVALVVVSQAVSGGSDDAPSASSTTPAASGSGTTVTEVATEPAGDEPAQEPVAEEPAAEDPVAEAPGPPGLGTPVADGKFEFVVTALEPGVGRIGNEYLGTEPQGQFLLVHVTVTNIGDVAQMFDSGSQKLVDTAGRTHSADTLASIYLDDANSFLTSINPGNAVQGTVVFDVPADAVPATLELHDSMFSGGVTVGLQ